MKIKRMILICGAIIIALTGIFFVKDYVLANSGQKHAVVKTNIETSEQKTLKNKDKNNATKNSSVQENPAIKTALHDFASLDEFNAKFSIDKNSVNYTSDEQWMIPDLSNVGSNDGGKTHGWSISPSKEVALEGGPSDEKGNKIKQVEGASAKDIRKALAERDKGN